MNENKNEIMQTLRTAIIAAVAACLIGLCSAIGLMLYFGNGIPLAIAGFGMIAAEIMYCYIMLADEIKQVKKNG